MRVVFVLFPVNHLWDHCSLVDDNIGNKTKNGQIAATIAVRVLLPYILHVCVALLSRSLVLFAKHYLPQRQ